MWQALVQATGRLVKEVSWALRRGHVSENYGAAPANRPSEGLQRLILTDGVNHTLFEEFAAHRRSARGEEEVGWVLLGKREGNNAIALATLPAGMQRDAGVAHVLFDAEAQMLGSRIVRQQDRGLNMLGVVHTHPGSLRHPSDADFRGDSHWVAQLRSKEGVFGIGTADARTHPDALLETTPRPNVRCLGKLCYSWYGLRAGDGQYFPLAVELRIGPDLARPLHPVWETIAAHARRLNRLYGQQAKVTFDVVEDKAGLFLVVTVPLAEPGNAIRVLLQGKQASYFLQRGDHLIEADGPKDRVDEGVYLLLAEQAAQY
jgi:proteasome lid subunit RPN8/RPN11